MSEGIPRFVSRYNFGIKQSNLFVQIFLLFIAYEELWLK